MSNEYDQDLEVIEQHAGETINRAINFANRLAPGDYLVGTPIVFAVQTQGQEAVGDPAITNVARSTDSEPKVVTFRLATLNAYKTFRIDGSCGTNNGATIKASALVKVLP